MPAEGHGVQPASAVGQLDSLRARRRARGVVDRDRRILVAHRPPRPRPAPAEELPIGRGAQHDAMLDGEMPQGLVELGIDQRHRRSRVLDDVADLLGVEPKVHRHQDPAVDADAEEAHQEARRVGRDDRDPRALADAELVERAREAP